MVTMPLGITQSKEYAEPEWFIDIAVAVVWVSFGIVFFATVARRRIRHIYVSNWYYGALIIAVGLLHIVNNIALPVSLTKSYPVNSGAADAMVQWWYGHNAVAFFLTAGFLGNDVLLRPAPGAAAAVELPLFHRQFLGADIDLHVGGPAPSALYGAARLGAVARAWRSR